ncbi:helix-turn-helix transcriptional regulator [Planosporangium thailandense]|uniref:Helix-turn-helix transcriptional regulator n=1 Tax=Planosporangium thailandense TaxID=765197 RepID=A0ABX0XWT1_9ACTN|nr:helix-turn-helix domain-containing protein [Planosporangium thailandense]NJC70286.1 helix-turn-helix transcriptional regulator [Planosporangium thailandense]
MEVRNRDIGRRVSYWRSRRGLTRQQFADLVGRSMSWVDKVESGQRGLVRLPMLEAVADALQIDVAALTDDDAAHRAVTRPDSVEVRAIRAALSSYTVILGGADAPPDLVKLRGQVDYACAAWLSSHFGTLGRVLPGIITASQRAVATLSGDERLEATRCLVMSYRLASSTLLKLEAPELAWLAADRAMLAARCTDDPVCLARATRSAARAMACLGQPREALDALIAMADRMESALARPDPNLLSLYGMLLLPAEIVAAQNGDADTALTMHRRADQVAHRLTPGYCDPVTAFGVTNVALHRLAALVRMEEGGRAVAFARTIEPQSLVRLPRERKAAYLLDMAEAHRQCRHYSEATAAVLRAEQIAPDEVRRRPSTHTLIRRLLSVSSGEAALLLRRLADRAGVIP